jgi:hypothetical protein
MFMTRSVQKQLQEIGVVYSEARDPLDSEGWYWFERPGTGLTPTQTAITGLVARDESRAEGI